MNQAEKEAKYRLGDLYNKKLKANNKLLFCKKNGKTYWVKNSKCPIKGNLKDDLSYLASISNQDIEIPIGSGDREESSNGYVFSYARSNGDNSVGLLNDHWSSNTKFNNEEQHILQHLHDVPIPYLKHSLGFKKMPKHAKEEYINWAKKYPLHPELLNVEGLTFNTLKSAFIKTKKFKDKAPILHWRGAPTGGFNNFQREQGHNHKAVERKEIIKYFKNNPSGFIDISLKGEPKDERFKLEKGKPWNGGLNIFYTKDYASRGHKYLIELQGNDYASNTYWIYSKDCIVFRPDFLKSYTPWDCHLEPWVHYVPFDHANYGDLVDKIKWCEKNTGKCEIIIKNANNLHSLMNNNEHKKKVYTIMLNKITKNLK